MASDISVSNNDSSLNLRRCTRCILPETYPRIDFDNNGVCNYCRAYNKIIYKNEHNFDLLLKSVHFQGNFDCVVPLSGGRDSTFVLHQMVRRYGLKPVAYNYDNGFVNPFAVQNMQAACNKLGVKLVRQTSRLHSIARKCFLKINLKKSPLHFLSTLCYGCQNTIWGGAMKLANEHGIPLIVSGESKIEEAEYKKIQLNQLQENTQDILKVALKSPFLYSFGKCAKMLFCLRYPSKETALNAVQTVRLFDYARYDEKQFLTALNDDLEWQSDKHTTWRFDCFIHNVILLMTYQLMGMTEWDDYCSVEIREDMMTRDAALERISRFADYRNQSLPKLDEILYQMELNQSERHKILSFVSQSPQLENKWGV